MVVPQALAQTCPQCAADIRLSGARCKSCGFWLPAAPPRRTAPPQPRPTTRPRGSERRRIAWVLAIGGFVVLGLLAAGVMVWLQKPARASVAPQASTTMAAPSPSALPRIEPSALLTEARRKASSWHRDAALIGLSAGPLDMHGVAPDGNLELTYAEPSGQRVSSGAETSVEHLVLSSSGGALSERVIRGAKGRIVPEPNCVLEAAWAAARQAGASAEARLSLRYGWSEKHDRAVWEIIGQDGQVQRRLDGVSCSILTR